MRAATGFILAVLAAGYAVAECPAEDALRAQLAKIDLAKAARTAKFGQPIPSDLHQKAIAKISQPYSSRDGQRVIAAMVAPLSADKIWRALNDKEHHDLGYMPVKFSTVLDGPAHGKERVLFQYYLRAGIGRWWASRMIINSNVHKKSAGKIWEVYWDDWTDKVDRTKPPVSDVVGRIRPIESSEGSWMLIPLGDECTLVEEYSEADAGGALGPLQALMASGAIRDTLVGMMKMAEEHFCDGTAAAPFLGPDGKPVDGEIAKKPTSAD